MMKRVAAGAPVVANPAVTRICSVSDCISEDFADWISHWKHNGYWLFDSPAVISEIASAAGVDTSGLTTFYYEVYEREFDDDSSSWSPFDPDLPFPVNVSSPENPTLLGFDVCSYSVGSAPECSPLSCNALANEIPVNGHCLLESLEQAVVLLEAGAFTNSEPGPYRIFAVYSLG